MHLAAAANLGWLHAVLQVAMGWTNSHLHQFICGEHRYADPLAQLEQYEGDPPVLEAKADLEDLTQYILRNPFSVQKMTLEQPADIVIYRSRLNAKINRYFEVFTPSDFLAAITQHIPGKGVQMVRYYSWYSNKMPGVRHRGLPHELVVRRPGCSPPPLVKLPPKRWCDLILRVWHVDPLRWPVCQNPMRVVAVIDDPRVGEKILRHLGA